MHTCLVSDERGEHLQSSVCVVETSHGFGPLEQEDVGYRHSPKPRWEADVQKNKKKSTTSNFLEKKTLEMWSMRLLIRLKLLFLQDHCNRGVFPHTHTHALNTQTSHLLCWEASSARKCMLGKTRGRALKWGANLAENWHQAVKKRTTEHSLLFAFRNSIRSWATYKPE